ncbi:MAG: hypothetical protein K0R15_1137 [Clostridiales bacterium]|nr:hypothetical protein [Clostridiales bacterium]
MPISPLDMQVNVQRTPSVNENKLYESHRNDMHQVNTTAATKKDVQTQLQKVVKSEKKEEEKEYKYDAKEKGSQEYQQQPKKDKEKKTLKKVDDEEIIHTIKKIDIKI